MPEGGSATFTVRLSNKPSGEVSVSVAAAPTGDTDLTGAASLTFTNGDWNQPRPVTLRAAQDGDDLRGTRVFNVTSSGAEFNNLAVTVTATEGDTDKRGFIVNPRPAPSPWTEGGTHTYTVRLGTQPTADVTVYIAKAQGGDTDITVTPISLTFTAGNYSHDANGHHIRRRGRQRLRGRHCDHHPHRHHYGYHHIEQAIGGISVTAKDNDPRHYPQTCRQRRCTRKRHGNLYRQAGNPAPPRTSP